jgi:hypothetical protein
MKMKKILLLFIVAIMLTFSMSSKASAVPIPYADTIDNSNQAPIGNYFLDDDANKKVSPYYRRAGDDWGWSHNTILTSFTSATLNISAFDVDYDGETIGGIFYTGERNRVSAINNNGDLVSLGFLAGNNDIWAYTTFTLNTGTAADEFGTVIASGLEVWFDIDSTNIGWAVTLAKSTLCLDECEKPNPKPGVVPEPSTYLLLGSGIAGLAFWRRKQQAKKA